MSKNLGLIVVIVVLVLLGGCGCSGYNKMVGLDQNVKGKWGNVQSEYQRRSDLIPNLVSTVQGAANFEKSTLEAVVNARAKATQTTIDAGDLSPEKIAQFQQAQGQLSGALSRLLVAVEAYPELKANQNFVNLQTQLEGTENRIKVSRNDFNTSVQEYNTVVKTFPNNIFSGMFGFKEKGYFSSDPGAEKAPEVKFN
ncbi:LemA family protein [Pollutibacter soli]|jgi:LemA protein|uniref:LemA family protein n=1 Tax=Pollutibacter soli TaxID=3034157 RepID=UPI003013A58B